MELLRSDEGCPWDREQTQESIRENIIEKAYEVVDRIDKQDYSGLAEELGDLLFSIVNIARFLGLDSELLLKEANQRFRNRFNYIEESVVKNDRKLTDLSLEELEKLWHQAKNNN